MTEKPTIVTGMSPTKREQAKKRVGNKTQKKVSKFVKRRVTHRLSSVYNKLQDDGWKVEVEGLLMSPDGVVYWVARIWHWEDVTNE